LNWIAHRVVRKLAAFSDVLCFCGRLVLFLGQRLFHIRCKCDHFSPYGISHVYSNKLFLKRIFHKLDKCYTYYWIQPLCDPRLESELIPCFWNRIYTIIIKVKTKDQREKQTCTAYYLICGCNFLTRCFLNSYMWYLQF
jgi:hypothetical protein